jgi:hypothetical protein
MCKPHKVNGAKQNRLGRVGLEKVSEQRQVIESHDPCYPEDSDAWYHDGEEEDYEQDEE